MNGLVICLNGISRPLSSSFSSENINWTYFDSFTGISLNRIPPNSVNYLVLQCIDHLSLEEVIRLLTSLRQLLAPRGLIYLNELSTVLLRHLQRIAYERGSNPVEIINDAVVRGYLHHLLEVTGFDDYKIRNIDGVNYIILI